MTSTKTSTVSRLADTPFDGHSHDFDFLNGSFDVTNRTRVGKPFTGREEWQECSSTAVARTHLGGGVSIDEMYFPETRSYRFSFRLYDVEAKRWSVYRICSRDGRLGPPVHGTWRGDRCRLTGEEVVDGVVVQVAYSWSEVTDTTAHWEQAYSLHGLSWEVNQTMDWVRRPDLPDHLAGRKLTSDFDFIVGDWQIDHRRLSDPLTDDGEWTDFSTPWTAWTYLNGAVTVDELGLSDSKTRGFTLRSFDPRSGQWSIYWVNSGNARMDEHPMVGAFTEEGSGVFEAPDVYGGQPIRCRFIWSDIAETTTRWRQEFSTDGGQTWKANWYMDSTRLP